MSYSFTLTDHTGNVFQAAQRLPLIVYFYPKDNTPGCTQEATEFSALYNEFKQLGYEVVGISRDSVASHQKFVCKLDIPFALLSDPDETVCQQFGVMKEKNMYGKKVWGIERSTFVLNKQGKIVQEWRKVKAAGHAECVLAWVKGFQAA
ncbi:MAG: peroxiredoxin [Neisseriaceae bacterium]|nr:peroxiredoxin [Neisseriaceae bacterium]